MRWFRRSAAKGVDGDRGPQGLLVRQIREQFGDATGVAYAKQVAALMSVLDGDDGLMVALRVVRDVADGAYAGAVAQVGRRFTIDRANYRPVWRAAGPSLRSPLFGLACGFHPYIHLAAAVTTVEGNARRCVRLADAGPLLARTFEVLDLATAGWEFGRVPVDVDAANLTHHLIGAAAQIRLAMKQPPPLPLPMRELMRRNNTTQVYDAATGSVAGGINLGGLMRPAFLV